jgi:ABC-type nitrate/sulfonate/bicarbonate transport system substrate-binding protein
VALSAAALVIAGCGGGDEAAGDGEREVIRFAFAPDPVWDYLIDTGTMAEWEEEYNLTIETSESWDEFAYFAGGHGDIVSMGTHELPVLEAETGIKVVAFGAYNHQRVPMYTRAEDGYNTIADVPLGSRTCMSSSVSNTIVWSIIANELHGLNYRVGEGDFDIAVQDHFVMPELVDRGECIVAAAIPEAAVPLLRSGELEVMYDGRSPWLVYQEDICQCDHRGIMSNLFVATESWYDEHPEQAKAFLDLWQRGIDLWQRDKAEIIAAYPQHFSVESQEDIDYMIEFMEGPNDWFVQTVYMDEAWVEEEMKFYDYMIAGDWMAADDPLPRFEAIQP